MSIWCSWPEIGWEDAADVAYFESGRTEHIPGHFERGHVRSYASGWSNHYPTTDGEVEQPASVSVAHIAPWCVPGRQDTEDWEAVGPWLRLDMATTEHHGKEVGKATYAAVVLGEEAARSLRDDLDKWLATPKVQSVEEPDRD